MSDPQAVIAAAIVRGLLEQAQAHDYNVNPCDPQGFRYHGFIDADHLAAEIDQALGGLREEVEQRGAYIRRADGTSVPAVTVRHYTTPYTPEGNQ